MMFMCTVKTNTKIITHYVTSVGHSLAALFLFCGEVICSWKLYSASNAEEIARKRVKGRPKSLSRKESFGLKIL